MDNKNNEYCAFVIWNVGIKHAAEIADSISSDPNFDLLEILRFNVGNMRRFVYDMYAYSPPQRHQLRKKVRVLNKEPQKDVLVIFTVNKNPNYKPVGLNENHIQCQTVYDFKEKIRSKYNKNSPDGYHDVIHSSDTQKEAEHIAKIIGLPNYLDRLQKKEVVHIPDESIILNQDLNVFKDLKESLEYYLRKIFK